MPQHANLVVPWKDGFASVYADAIKQLEAVSADPIVMVMICGRAVFDVALRPGDAADELAFLRVSRYIGFHLQVAEVSVVLPDGCRMKIDTMYRPPAPRVPSE